MNWKYRRKLFFNGAPLALIPALAFLPALAYLVIDPAIAHASTIAFVLCPVLVASMGLGVSRLARCCVYGPFDLLTALSFGAMMILLVIASYTGLFLAVFAAKM
ncbi:MAG TPA: hypothetical protein VFA89_06555 [Terriglobales bacterium]|nr:hypothetical protein [Terriglobales bacterium]